MRREGPLHPVRAGIVSELEKMELILIDGDEALLTNDGGAVLRRMFRVAADLALHACRENA
jgi:hypothetical protein